MNGKLEKAGKEEKKERIPMEMQAWELAVLLLIVAIPFSDKLKAGTFFDKYSDFEQHH